MEAETDEDTYVPPDLVKYSPGVSKCWADVVYTTGTPATVASYNVTSLTDTAGGDGLVNIGIDFSGAAFSVVATNAGNVANNIFMVSTSAGTARWVIENAADDNFSCAMFGDQ